MPRATADVAHEHSPLLAGSHLSNAAIESQVADDRDPLPYLQEVEGIGEAHLPERRRSEHIHDDSAYGSYATPVEDREGFKSQSHKISDEQQPSQEPKKDQKPISWASLPRKDQLFILTLARLAEPIVQTSLGSYMFFMLKSFDQRASDSTISSQAGVLAGSFTFAQCLTAVMWGRLADKEWMGRKNVLMIGLLGTFISSLGFGFSKSFVSAMCFRSLGGALNGNVGVMRTMISEIVVEKKYQPKAFLVMPVTFNVGVLIGPLLGGWLQDPVHTFPKSFGPHSFLGGKDGVKWMRNFPYALPNLISAIFLFGSVALVFLGLEETHIDRRHRPNMGRQIGQAITRTARRVFSCGSTYRYTRLNQQDEEAHELDSSRSQRESANISSRSRPKLPYRKIFTRNVICTFLVHGLLAGHLGAFHNMWFLFLSTPRYDAQHPDKTGRSPQKLPFAFTGGLGLPPPTIGFALSIIGALGLCMQFGVYSRVTHRLGIVNTYRFALILFPVTYTMVPYLAMLPTRSKAPHAADGPWIWVGISFLLFIVVTGRTFSLPITQILVNNCSPHPSVLSSVHGLGQSVSAGARTLGPVIWSTLYGLGLHKGIVGLGFWTLCIESTLAFGASWLVYEGSGHEIKLEGDQ